MVVLATASSLFALARGARTDATSLASGSGCSSLAQQLELEGAGDAPLHLRLSGGKSAPTASVGVPHDPGRARESAEGQQRRDAREPQVISWVGHLNPPPLAFPTSAFVQLDFAARHAASSLSELRCSAARVGEQLREVQGRDAGAWRSPEPFSANETERSLRAELHWLENELALRELARRCSSDA
jgi:hypothetical protein